MAYVPTSQLPENEQNLFGPTGPTTPNPLGMLPPNATQTGGSSGSASGGSSSTPNAGSPTQFGSNASKLSDYLAANAPQVQQQANNISGQLGTQYNQVTGDVGNAVQGFQNSVNSGYAAPNQSTVDQAIKDAQAGSVTPQDVSGFQAQYNDQYTGPQNFETTAPYSNVQNEVQNAVSNAGLLNSPSGITTYLNKQNGGQDYTQGMQSLDSALLAGNPQAIQQVQNSAKPFAGLNSYFTTQAQNADQLVPVAQQGAQTANQSAHNAINPVVSGFNTNLQNEMQQATALTQGLNTNLNNYLGYIANGVNTLTPQQARQLGIDPTLFAAYSALPGSIQQLEAVANNQIPFNAPTGSDTFSPAPNTLPLPTQAQAATPQDYSEASALSQLLGGDFANPLNPADASQAGLYQKTLPIPQTNNQNLANEYFNALNSWWNSENTGLTPAAGTPSNPVPTNIDDLYTNALNNLGSGYNTLAQYLGQPLWGFSGNPISQPPSPPPSGGGLGGPGTPGGV